MVSGCPQSCLGTVGFILPCTMLPMIYTRSLNLRALEVCCIRPWAIHSSTQCLVRDGLIAPRPPQYNFFLSITQRRTFPFLCTLLSCYIYCYTKKKKSNCNCIPLILVVSSKSTANVLPSAAAACTQGFSQHGGFLCAEPWFFHVFSSEANVCQHHKIQILKTYVLVLFRISTALFCDLPDRTAAHCTSGVAAQTCVVGLKSE